MTYGEYGIWRKARKEHRCDIVGAMSKRVNCIEIIPAGSFYFDTQEANRKAGGFGTDRLCPPCAEQQCGVKKELAQ